MRRPFWGRGGGCTVLLLLAVASPAVAEPATTVFLNGVPTPVFFNDGDSFRALAGPYSGTKARLIAFNTLESHGPVHRWGDWHPKELYALAKTATLTARRGGWHCETQDFSADTYGRTLWYCPDLAQDLIANGLAHVFSVDDNPGVAELVAAQRRAQRARRGMWAKGIPTFLLTSIHSHDERPGRSGSYNRLVSSADGHSERWLHHDVYRECEQVCHRPRQLAAQSALAVVRALRDNSEAGPLIQGTSDPQMVLVVNTFVATGKIPEVLGERAGAIVQEQLTALRVQGRFAEARETEGACLSHVRFARRFVSPKPECLR